MIESCLWNLACTKCTIAFQYGFKYLYQLVNLSIGCFSLAVFKWLFFHRSVSSSDQESELHDRKRDSLYGWHDVLASVVRWLPDAQRERAVFHEIFKGVVHPRYANASDTDRGISWYSIWHLSVRRWILAGYFRRYIPIRLLERTREQHLR